MKVLAGLAESFADWVRGLLFPAVEGQFRELQEVHGRALHAFLSGGYDCFTLFPESRGDEDFMAQHPAEVAD